MGSKRVLEYSAKALNLVDFSGKAIASTGTDGKIMRLNNPHAVTLFYDVRNENDDGSAGVMSLEFDVYDEAEANIIWAGTLSSAIPIFDDLKGACTFGGGVTAGDSDGTIHNDAFILQLFNRIRFRINVTTASDDTGTCLISLMAQVQE